MDKVRATIAVGTHTSNRRRETAATRGPHWFVLTSTLRTVRPDPFVLHSSKGLVGGFRLALGTSRSTSTLRFAPTCAEVLQLHTQQVYRQRAHQATGLSLLRRWTFLTQTLPGAMSCQQMYRCLPHIGHACLPSRQDCAKVDAST